jgi:hypothetical protein
VGRCRIIEVPECRSLTGGGRQSQRRFADDLQIIPLSSQPGGRLSAAATPPTFQYLDLDKVAHTCLAFDQDFLLLLAPNCNNPSRSDWSMACRGYALSTYRVF